jgi:poly-gamma-glutamate synthesis protein (capsule biosynthesis protein)
LLFSEKLSFEIIPLKQCDEIPGVFKLNEKEETEFYNMLDERSRIIADDEKLEQAFDEYVSRVTPMYDAYIEPYFGRIYNALRQRGFVANLLSRKKRLLLLNIIRCSAHREVLLNMLNKNQER